MQSAYSLALPDLDHERSNAMLRMVLRNRITTNDAIRRIILPKLAPDTVQKMVRKLTKRGFLKRWRLHASKSYLRLGPSAIARWNYPESFARRLGPQKLSYEFGCLSLMVYHTPPLQRLLPEEIPAYFPGLPPSRDLMQWAYYREQVAAGERLVTVRVEFRLGADSIITKLAEQLHNYRRHAEFSALIDQQRLAIHVVAATPEQEEALHYANHRTPLPVELKTAHDPALTLFY